MKNRIGLTTTIILIILTFAQQGYSYNAPDPSKTFYADANGDQQLQLDDLPMHKSQVYLGVPAYNTPQLNNVDDRWNTCDVTGDFKCQLDDMTPLKAAVYLTPLPKNWDSWTIVDVSFPVGPLTSGSPYAFQIAPRALEVTTLIPNARPGINVKLTVAPDSPVQKVTLGGRVCPVVDPKCAVSVGLTAWQISTAIAPTETGSDGFSFIANEPGNLILLAEFSSQPTMRIAATSVRFNVTINAICNVYLNCAGNPQSMNETDTLTCPITYSAGCSGTLAESILDTCPNTVVTDNANGTGQYKISPAPGETYGGTSCLAAVEINGATTTNAVDILEVNQNPYFTTSPNPNAFEGTQWVYSPSFDDADLPDANPTDPGYVSCVGITNNTCGVWLTISGCDAYGTPSEASAPGSCGYDVTISDGYSAIAVQNVAITLNEVNQNPTFSSLPNDIIIRPSAAYNSVNGAAADSDLPNSLGTDPGYINNCAAINNTCSFGINASGSGSATANINMTFTAGPSEETCTVDVRCADGMGAAVTDTVNIQVRPTIWYVNDDAAGLNNGTSWVNAFTVLQNGVNAASSGDQVWVAEGTYHRPAGGTGPVLNMKNGVAVYGGFEGIETSLTQRGNPYIYLSSLDGESASYHVVTGNSNARLDGFFVTYGNAAGSGENQKGGGMYNSGCANLTIANVDFYYNYASYYGGGMYNNSSSPTIVNVIFDSNSSDHYGGGITNWASSNPNISKSRFYNNSAYSYGGGIHNDYSVPTIVNCVFQENFGNSLGGGIYNYHSSITVTNCTFTKNSSISRGGAMANEWSSDAIITNCIMWDDTGAIVAEIYNNSATPVITYSDIEGGYAGTGNINSDPKFVAYYTDLRLSWPASPCIDTGTSTGAPANDYDGNPRPMPLGGGIDMGAFEYQYLYPNWYVDDTATGLNNGTSWANAFMEVQDAMDAASSGEVIFAAAGTYTRPTSGNGPVLEMKNGVRVYGGFAGTETYLEQRLDLWTNESILDGENMSYHAVVAASYSVLDGFTVTRGNAAGVDPDYAGAGIFGQDLIGFQISYCNIDLNNAAGGGAGAAFASSHVTIKNSSIINNRTPGAAAGLYANTSFVDISDCDIWENASSTGGGGIAMASSIFTIMHSKFLNNQAQKGSGGAILLISEANPTIIKNCLFYNNYAYNYGGALNLGGSAAPQISNCTFNQNHASKYGGAVFISGANPVIRNSILWGDIGTLGGNEIYIIISGSATVSYSDIQGGYAGTMNFNINPLWVSGPAGAYYLSQIAAGQGSDSPCVDWGSQTAVAAGLANRTTRTDDVNDADYIDLGYHYQ